MCGEGKKKALGVTPGIAKCAEGEQTPDLFQVAHGMPLDYALEQASVMMRCVHRLTFVGVMEKDEIGLRICCRGWDGHWLRM